MAELAIETPAGLIGMIGLAVRTKLAAMMELTGMLIQPFGLMIGMLAATPEVLAEMAETAELTRAQRVELLHYTALVGRSELVAETGLAAGLALVLVAPAELIESTETLEILVALTAGILIASPTAQAEPLAEILEPVELLELAALLTEPLGPVELAELPVETPTELVVGLAELMVGLLAGLVGHPYSRR